MRHNSIKIPSITNILEAVWKLNCQPIPVTPWSVGLQSNGRVINNYFYSMILSATPSKIRMIPGVALQLDKPPLCNRKANSPNGSPWLSFILSRFFIPPRAGSCWARLTSLRVLKHIDGLLEEVPSSRGERRVLNIFILLRFLRAPRELPRTDQCAGLPSFGSVDHLSAR